MNSPQSPPCQYLCVGGLYGSGNVVLAGLLRKQFGWPMFDATLFHSAEARTRLARGELIESEIYWGKEFLPKMEWSVQVDLGSMPPSPRIVCGPFLKRSLRKRVIDMGRRPGTAGSAVWMVMLEVDPETAWQRFQADQHRKVAEHADRVLQAEQAGNRLEEELVLMTREMFDLNVQAYEPPLMKDGACVEENTLVLNGNDDRYGILARKVHNSIPGLDDIRVA